LGQAGNISLGHGALDFSAKNPVGGFSAKNQSESSQKIRDR
jgi:hypothetical protein